MSVLRTSLADSAIHLLRKLISTQSFSGSEDQTAVLIRQWLDDQHIETHQVQNNVYALNKHFDPAKPTILLNSHHDTVKPVSLYTRDPFEAKEEDGRLYGLGSNDAGGALVSLMATFAHLAHQENLRYNLILAATAEEENSGPNGLYSILSLLPPVSFAIVGEPTGMQLAIAEKGLLVIDAVAHGKAGHAAHNNTVNAISRAIEDITWLENFCFPKESSLLGPVKMTVTQINAGQQHNVVPDECRFVIDCRVNEHYTNKEVFEILQQNMRSTLTARSFRLNSSRIDPEHPIVKSGLALGRKTYGSPTLSDQAVLSCPSLKIGPGDSLRSHQADEFIGIDEIHEGIDIYINMLKTLLA